MRIPRLIDTAIILLFILAMCPFSLTIANNGVSANYLYILLPIFFWLTATRRFVFRQEILQIVLFYSLIYAAGIPADIVGQNADPFRRFTSFLVFIFPLFLSFVRFSSHDTRLFKQSVILISAYFSLQSILDFIYLSSHSFNVFEMKGAMGGQRFGFVLCLGFFITLFDDQFVLRKWALPQRVLGCSIILLGILLTFSRASVVALMGGLSVSLLSLFSRNRTSNPSHGNWSSCLAKIKNRALYFSFIIISIIGIYIFFQNYFDIKILKFYKVRLLDEFLSSTLKNHFLNEPDSSEGYRYYILNRILHYLAYHPLLGSNFKGLYLLYPEFSGGASTHNQYSDILLRTGMLGSGVWLYLLFRIIRLCRNDMGLKTGLMSILIYGFLHETFKLSQGSFIFGMLLSFSYSARTLPDSKHVTNCVTSG